MISVEAFRRVQKVFVVAGFLLLFSIDSPAQTGSPPSANCHVTDGAFTLCPDGTEEWSDVPAQFFPEAGSYLYADQADLDPDLATPDSPVDTFMLLYDECGRTEPLGSDEYVLVAFTTVEVEDDVEKLEHYVLHIFADGTLIFIEDGHVEESAEGEIRVEEIEGQRGNVGFGPSPNCAGDHVVAEFEIKLSSAGSSVDGAYSPDPQFWSSDPPEPRIIIVSERITGQVAVTVVRNVGTGRADGLRITQEPFVDFSTGQKVSQIQEVSGFSLAPGQTRTFVFSFPSEPPLRCGYSDVYDASGRLLAATACNNILEFNSPVTFDFVLPYATFVRDTLGTPADFLVEDPILDDLPSDWTVASLSPAPGEVFTLGPDESLVGQLVLDIPDAAPEGTIGGLVLPYVQPDTGFRAEIRLFAVADTTPPTFEDATAEITPASTLVVTAHLHDDVSSLSLADIFVEYSADGVVTFAQERMEITPPHEFNRLGISASGFEAELGPFPTGTEVSWKILAHDNASNFVESALQVTTIVPPPATQGVIDNGVVQLGINDEGHLNVPGDVPSSGTSTTFVGLRYLPTNAEATAPGCLCEGWGVADAISGVAGYANQAFDGVVNMNVLSFEATPSTAVSTVQIGETFQVTHDYHPSFSPNLYEATVTVENISDVDADVLYRRVMDWDIEPTAFSEFVTIVTIQGSEQAENVLFASDDGFASANPLAGPSAINFVGDAVDNGPSDHGALFDFGFGMLPPGQAVTFNIYYGAAGTEADAEEALSVAGGEVFSFGQPNTPDGPTLGTPNTFIFAFSGVGGPPIFSPDSDADDVLDELDNCPSIPNPDQRDSNFNGLGDACETPDLKHGTTAFLQALSDGQSVVEMTPPTVAQEPDVEEKLVRIVDFRITEGLTDSAAETTENLVDSLVEVGLVPVEEADELVDSVLEQIITQVSIDIKPGSFPNSVMPSSNGVIPVVILTTDDFDATTVVPLSVEFGPLGATESHGRGHIEDVDSDGDLDLVLHFRTQATGIQCGDASASLVGSTFDGQVIKGLDSINTAGCE